ncbi:cyclin-dependent kinase 11B [Leptonychotes weddellii]|uniref:Cyclin-dependent kinase 11B n=1 Tax=Leptonychotes weddellii TaxID=9713 RepID=A0A7F8QP96_LEPWE|nr:cyclin-dependent kinase 11B [Leptonychotes weddellii]
MGDEKDSWKVKTLDEILQEKKRRKEQEEKAEIKRLKNSDDRDSKRDSLEEGELRDHRMEITIRNSPYRREDSMEDRGEEDDSLAIKPPQQMSRKEKAHHRKDEKRKEKRKHARAKEKEREHERRKRHREEQDKARREWERQKRREMAREHSRRERKRDFLVHNKGCFPSPSQVCVSGRFSQPVFELFSDEIVALKRLKMEKEKEGFPITSLREINTILKAQHPNIVTVREIVVGSNMDKIYIVMNYVEHDLKSLMETMKQPFLPGEVKTLMIQLLRGVKHLHDNWILHRDLKTSNLLLSHAGILKVGDFGLAREYGSPLKAYTPVVVTLWYRAPELLLGAKEYSTAVDMWSVGCIFGELLTQKPLFPGKSEIDQINKVFKDLGTPSEKIWPGYNDLPAVKKMTFTEYPYNNLRKRFGALLSDQGFDLMNKFLTYFPGRRVSAEDGLKHEYFRETPLPIDPSMFPTWPAKSEQQRVKRGTSPRPPEGGLGYSQLGDDDLKETGFHLTTTNQGASAAGPGFSLKF